MVSFCRRKELLEKYDAFFRNPGGGKITQQEKEWISNEFDRRLRRAHRRTIIRGKIEMFFCNIITKPINACKEPLPIVWHSEFIDECKYPFCPVCDEFAYKKTHCIFCGRRFIWKDCNE